MNYDEIVKFVKEHACASDVEEMSLCSRAHVMYAELRNIEGWGRTLVLFETPISEEHAAMVFLRNSLMGFGPKEWVIAKGARRNFVEQTKKPAKGVWA